MSIPNHCNVIVRLTLDSPIASHFLTTISTEKVLLLQPQQMCVALSLHLSMPLDMKGLICMCGREHKFGLHVQSCKCGGRMILRHESLKKFFVKMCKTAGNGSRMEPQSCSVLPHNASGGQAHDFTLLNPTNPGTLKEAVKSGMSLLKKHNKAKSACHSKLCTERVCH